MYVFRVSANTFPVIDIFPEVSILAFAELQVIVLPAAGGSIQNSYFLDVALKKLQNDGTGSALYINSDTGTGIGLSIDPSQESRAISVIDSSNRDVELVHFRIQGSSSTGEVLELRNDGLGPCQTFIQTQDVEVMDFDNCTDGGTSHTTVAGSIKVQMPNGSTGYINVYT